MSSRKPHTAPAIDQSKGNKQTVHIEPGTDFNEDWERLQDGAHDKQAVEITLDPVNLFDLLEGARVRPTDTIEKQPACLLIEKDGKDYVFGSLGDISTITGKAKWSCYI